MHLSASTGVRLGLVALTAAAACVVGACSDDDTDGDVQAFCESQQPPDGEPYVARVERAIEHGSTNPLTGEPLDDDLLALAREATRRIVEEAPADVRTDTSIVLAAREAAERGEEVTDIDDVRRAGARVDEWMADNCDD